MNFTIIGIQLLLCLVFLTSAISKSISFESTKATFSKFIPSPILSISSTLLLIAIEITVAVLLLIQPHLGAYLSISLLLLFSVWIIINIFNKKEINCNCLGKLYDAPLGWNTIIRNTLLLILSILLLFSLLESHDVANIQEIPSLLKENKIAFSVFIFITLSLFSLVFLLDERVKTLKRVKHVETVVFGGLPAKEKAPYFENYNAQHKLVSLDTLLESKKPILMMFLHPNCNACEELIPVLLDWHEEVKHQFTIVFLSKDDEKFSDLKKQKEIEFLALETIDLIDGYNVAGFPTIVHVAENGKIAEPYAVGEANIIRLLEKLSV